ncbi:phage tail spike protein [Latilactobacillus sakei]
MSMPILFEANATDFNNLGLGPLPETITATVTEERNGQFILEMQYPVDGIRASLIAKNRILKVDAGHKLKDQRFVIKRINRIMGNDGLSYSIYAEHISYITADYALKPTVAVNGSGSTAMSQWLNGIIDSNRIHVDSDITTDNTTSWTIDKVQNARQALGGVQGSILDVWGGEYRFDNLNISLLRHRGTVSNTLLSYGRNITDFDQEENITNTYTSIYPFASYSVQNGDTSEQKILTIPDLVVDSEYVKNFPNRKIQVVDFSDKFSTDEKPTVERLAELAKSYIKSNNVGVPTVSTKISFVDLSKTENYKEFAPLEELDLCDEVPFVFDKFGIKTTAKVSRIVWNVLLDSYDSLELGELKTNLGDIINDTNNTANDAKDAANDAKNNADNAVASANGKNTNWYGPEDPSVSHLSELREGDSWYKPNGEDTELYYWENGQWVFILSTKDAHDAADAADKAAKEAEEAKKQANKAVDGANQAVADAGFAKQQVIDVDKTANQAKADAAAAGQQAKDALTNAGAALTNAKNALDNVNKLDQTVKTEVTNINGQLSQKVNQTTFDTLKGTVTSQGTIINQNKAAIQLKADLSLVNTIKQTVTNNTTTIDLNSKEIKLKANQSTVDSLNGTVKNLDAEQKIQAGQIAQTVSKTELTSKLNGYATQTWTQGQIKTEADQINIGVQKVQTNLDNMQIGSRNYLLNSDASDGTNHWNVYNNEWVIDKSVAIDGIASFRGKTAEVWSGGTVNGIWQAMSNISPNSNILVSFYAKADKNGASLHSEPNGGVGAKDFTLTTDWKRYSYSGTLKTAAVYWMMKTIGANYWLAKPQVETGTKVTDYHRAVEDYTSQVEFSQLKITVNSVQTTVSNKADKSQVTQLAGQITSAIQSIDKLNTQYTQVQQTIKGIQTTVGNKADKSQVTQLAGQITSVVGSIGSDNLVVDGSFEHVAIGSKPLWWTLSYMPNNMVVIANPPASNATVRADAHVLKLTGAATGNVEPSGPFFSVTPGDEFYCEFKTRWSTTGLKGDVVLGLIFYDVDRKTITGAVGGQSKTAENWAKHSGVVKAPSNAVYAKAWVAWRNSNNAVAYVTVTDLIIRRNSATQSQITQLANDINLRVQKGDVVNQINISPEGILIAGQKIHITGQTRIDNAVIKDAMIANIKADKITAGTLNAANVNVINLNANNITTGTLRAIAISGSTINGAKINSSDITSSNTDNAAGVNISNGTIYFKSGNGAEVGMIFPTYDAKNGKANGLAIEQIPGSILSINTKNTSTGTSAPVIQVPASSNQSNPQVNYYGHKNFYDDTKFNGILNIASGGHINSSGQDVSYNGNNKSSLGIGSNTSWSNVAEATKGKFTVWGEFQVWNGAKNAIVATRDGFRAMYAYETAESYFGDIGESQTDDTGTCVVKISDLFADTIHMEDVYQVFVSSYSASLVWVESRNYGSFIVKSEKPNAKFAWEIKGIRRGFKNKRMELQEEQFDILDTENHEPMREYKLEEKTA